MQATSQEKAQPSAGVGSIWNKNSWHWYSNPLTSREEKNYTEWSKKRVLGSLEQIKFPLLLPPATSAALAIRPPMEPIRLLNDSGRSVLAVGR